MNCLRIGITACSALLTLLGSAGGVIYEVGPGRDYTSVSQVPLESLTAGDQMLIHWRSEPYREKWVCTAQGTAENPVVFHGVPGPQGQLPIIDGENATTRLQLDYWNENRGVIKIGGSSNPPDDIPHHIIIENLDVRGARPPYTFIDDAGNNGTYSSNAAAVYLEVGHHIIIRNCIIRDSGNGLFIGSANRRASEDILVEGNYFHSNGLSGNAFIHNSYCAALRITYQFNRYGPLVPGSIGTALKDRSAGTVVRYNWIEGGNRQLDLVEAEDSTIIRNDPAYRETFVYGNILIEPDGAGNRQMMHYGGDNTGQEDTYRRGWLYVYHNTLISTRSGRTTVLRLSTDLERADARNNIFYTTAGGSNLAILEENGQIDLSRNWINQGWVDNYGQDSIVNDAGDNITGTDPGFRDFANQTFYPQLSSPCIDAAIALHQTVPVEFYPLQHYRKHRQGTSYHRHGTIADLGAYEWVNWCEAISGPSLYTDVNSDCIVNWADAGRLIGHYSDQTCLVPTWCNQTDLDYSGSVGFPDAWLLIQDWLKNANIPDA